MKISDPPGSLPVVDIKRDTQKVADGPVDQDDEYNSVQYLII